MREGTSVCTLASHGDVKHNVKIPSVCIHKSAHRLLDLYVHSVIIAIEPNLSFRLPSNQLKSRYNHFYPTVSVIRAKNYEFRHSLFSLKSKNSFEMVKTLPLLR